MGRRSKILSESLKIRKDQIHRMCIFNGGGYHLPDMDELVHKMIYLESFQRSTHDVLSEIDAREFDELLMHTLVHALLTSNKETIKKYRKILTPRNGNLTWATARITECRNDPRSHITYAVMAGIVTGRFDLGEGYPKLEPIIPALLCNTDCAQLKITPASDGTIAVVTTEEVSTAKKIKPSGKGRRQSRC